MNLLRYQILSVSADYPVDWTETIDGREFNKTIIFDDVTTARLYIGKLMSDVKEDTTISRILLFEGITREILINDSIVKEHTLSILQKFVSFEDTDDELERQ